MMRYAPGGLTADERPCVQLSEFFSVVPNGTSCFFIYMFLFSDAIFESDDEFD